MSDEYKKYLIEKEKIWTGEGKGSLDQPESYFINMQNWMKKFHIFFHSEETFLKLQNERKG